MRSRQNICRLNHVGFGESESDEDTITCYTCDYVKDPNTGDLLWGHEACENDLDLLPADNRQKKVPKEGVTASGRKYRHVCAFYEASYNEDYIEDSLNNEWIQIEIYSMSRFLMRQYEGSSLYGYEGSDVMMNSKFYGCGTQVRTCGEVSEFPSFNLFISELFY